MLVSFFIRVSQSFLLLQVINCIKWPSQGNRLGLKSGPNFAGWTVHLCLGLFPLWGASFSNCTKVPVGMVGGDGFPLSSEFLFSTALAASFHSFPLSTLSDSVSLFFDPFSYILTCSSVFPTAICCASLHKGLPLGTLPPGVFYSLPSILFCPLKLFMILFNTICNVFSIKLLKDLYIIFDSMHLISFTDIFKTFSN